ncbi:hypothetical protein [Hymenobacter sp. GOD-10R]|uniref:hypothetical protein n=1 Tax=Hymenobacter sp. GOD-10R TaxID=3093922 RepID=UPI002D78A991|nr:hypothetical protein [Hymenobacter sp. GOD-10R]WRQ27080.1 hypothetical protein SD425_18565 [Hymenobacter sp. GOD-10R]
MRYKVLTNIKAEDNLAQLFNAYQRQLHTLECLSLPNESMGDYQALLRSVASDAPSESAQHVFNHAVPRFYALQVLSNSLTDLHKNIGWCIKALTEFFDQYDGDLTRYAIETRLKVVDEFGSDDETDWEEDGFDEKGQKWKVTYKDDEKTLKRYSLHADLEQYFKQENSCGEKIGSSHPEDFAYFSTLVENATDFNSMKFLRQAFDAELPLYRQNEAGDMVQQSLGDEVENELNEALRNESIVGYFNTVLELARQAAITFVFATTADDYRKLLTQLQAVRDVCPS